MSSLIKNRIIAFEGSVASGKTTQLDILRKDAFCVIDEYTDYANKLKLSLPKFPPARIEDAQDNFKFYLNIERERKQDAENIKSEKPLLIDRSTYTLLAFERGASTITGINIYDWAKETLHQEREKIIVPDLIIYLDLGPNLCRERIRKANMNTPDFFTQSGFSNGFKDTFIEISKENPNLITFVDASLPKEQINNTIMKILNS